MNSQNIAFSSIFIPVNASDKDQVIKSIAWTVDRDPKFKAITTDRICDSIWLCDHFHKNEMERPSVTDDGMVILTVTSSLVSESYIALTRLAQPIAWNAADTNPVDIVAVVVSPCAVSPFDAGYDRDKGLHLQQLSRLTRFLNNKEHQDHIRAAQSPEVLYAYLKPTLPQEEEAQRIAA